MIGIDAKERRKVRLSMDIEPEMHKQLKIEVAHREMSITEYVTRMLANSLELETETRKAS